MNKTIFAVSLIILMAAIISVFVPQTVTTLNSEVQVLIDAGHGDPDGGAVAEDGTAEADLNLSIASKIYEKLSENGIKCAMIRNSQESIYTEGNTIHEKKVSDIKNRVKSANKNKNALVISIHMNTFPSQDVYGAQVFYKKNDDKSKVFAEEIQKAINLKFQKENEKSIKSIPKNVYFFNHIQNNCVLVECGFLTNQNDLRNLKDEKYQYEIANTISEVLIYKLLGE